MVRSLVCLYPPCGAFNLKVKLLVKEIELSQVHQERLFVLTIAACSQKIARFPQDDRMALNDQYCRPLEELKKSAIEPIPKSTLETMPTKALLGRLRRLRQCADSPEAKLWTPREYQLTKDWIIFKETEIWQTAWEDLKGVLSKREHVERGSKEKRRQNALLRRHR